MFTITTKTPEESLSAVLNDVQTARPNNSHVCMEQVKKAVDVLINEKLSRLGVSSLKGDDIGFTFMTTAERVEYALTKEIEVKLTYTSVFHRTITIAEKAEAAFLERKRISEIVPEDSSVFY